MSTAISPKLPMPTDPPTIRIATIDDAPALAEFNRSIARETENLSLIPAVVLSGVKAVFETPAHGFYVVAEAQAAGPTRIKRWWPRSW